MNEVMKIFIVVVIIIFLFMFVVGIYGMNFDFGVLVFNMFEFGWVYGYLVMMFGMVFVFGVFFVYFCWEYWF